MTNHYFSSFFIGICYQMLLDKYYFLLLTNYLIMTCESKLFLDSVGGVLKDGEYYLSVIDVIDLIKVSKSPYVYWSKLKHQFKEKGILLFLDRLSVPSKKKSYKREVASINDLKYILNFIDSSNADLLINCFEEMEDNTCESIEKALETFLNEYSIFNQKTVSGVLYVTKNHSGWVYTHDGERISDKYLIHLENKVKNRNLEWTVKNDDIYEDNLTNEWSGENYCILDEVF